MDFYLFLKTWEKILVKNTVKNFLIQLKKSTTDAIKTASKRAIQKVAEATSDLIGNKIADKIVSASKKPAKELPKEKNIEVTNHKKRYISPEERQQIIDELRLVPKKDAYF